MRMPGCELPGDVEHGNCGSCVLLDPMLFREGALPNDCELVVVAMVATLCIVPWLWQPSALSRGGGGKPSASVVAALRIVSPCGSPLHLPARGARRRRFPLGSGACCARPDMAQRPVSTIGAVARLIL
jgi:hypothetical protein